MGTVTLKANMQFEKELSFLRSVAMHAGELALGYQRRGVTAENKADLSPVTIADRECEKLIASRIAEAFPGDGLLGEEGVNESAANGRKWIIDPIDGTRDFLRGLPLWAVLIGLEIDGEVVAGVAHMPARGETYHAHRGRGAYLNDVRIHASHADSAASALLCVNGFNNLKGLPFASRMMDWMSGFWAVRSMGGCVDAMMVARGQAEVWIEPHAQPWDLAPLKVILEEAGARFLNLDGGSSIYGGDCVACAPGLESEVRALMTGPPLASPQP